MSVTIRGTDNSASTPAVTGTDGDTGLYFPATNQLALATNGTARVVVDSSGRVGVGVSAPDANLQVNASNFALANSYNTLTSNFAVRTTNAQAANVGGEIALGGANNDSASQTSDFVRLHGKKLNSTSTNVSGYFAVEVSDDSGPAPYIFERMRINYNGNVGIGTTSPATLLHIAGTGTSLFRVQSTNSTAGNEIIGTSVLLNSANATSSDYAYLAGIDGGSDRFYVLGNGDVRNTNNSYGAISDQRLKQDIVDATSQWDDIKNLRFRKYRLKDNPQGPLQLGLISQEAELVSPGLIDEFNEYGYVEVVDEDGNVTQERKATGEKIKAIKYSILYMKATKALQEAIQRIEALEAKVTALEEQVLNLGSN